MGLAERVDPDGATDEKTMLVQYLDHLRATVAMKARGVDAAGAAATVGASTLTLGGLVKHLTLVEHSWFEHRFVDGPGREPWIGVDWESDPDWEFRTGATEDVDDLLAEYDAACARSNAIIAAAELDDLLAWSGWEGRERPNLRWVILHMIEETARHAGHADLLREAIDGVVGE
ncbi:DinB family protein [Euzebya rosea]|uniref:DinB family protein n=1 Tax=Euzebya rosea TaxID=2052804 RepID=UPI00196AD246|nr:DinB family protein [Euzebya rosea]